MNSPVIFIDYFFSSYWRWWAKTKESHQNSSMMHLSFLEFYLIVCYTSTDLLINYVWLVNLTTDQSTLTSCWLYQGSYASACTVLVLVWASSVYDLQYIEAVISITVNWTLFQLLFNQIFIWWLIPSAAECCRFM